MSDISSPQSSTLDRSYVMNALKEVVPLMQQSSTPVDTLIEYAANKNLAPDLLGHVAKAFNILKSQNTYASSEDKGRTVDLLDVDDIVNKYQQRNLTNKAASITTNIISFTTLVPTPDTSITTKVASTKLSEGRLEDLFTGNTELNKSSIEMANNYFESSINIKVASEKPEVIETEENYIDLINMLQKENSNIELKFAKYFSPQNTTRNIEFYNIEADALAVNPVQEASALTTAFNKLAKNLNYKFNLDDSYIIRLNESNAKKLAAIVDERKMKPYLDAVNTYNKNLKVITLANTELNKLAAVTTQNKPKVNKPKVNKPKDISSANTPSKTDKSQSSDNKGNDAALMQIIKDSLSGYPEGKAQAISIINSLPGSKENPESVLINSIKQTQANEYLNDLLYTDPVLSKLDPQTQTALTEVYMVAKDYHPELLLNKAALRTFLRQAAETSGVDLNTVATLSDINKNVNQSKIRN